VTKLSNIKIGVQLGSFKLPFKQAIMAAGRLGVQGVEIDARQDLNIEEMTPSAIRQIKKMLDDHNLRVSSFRFRTRRGYDCRDELERRVAATKKVMKLAYDFGASVVVNQIGQVSSDHGTDSMAILRDALCDIGIHGQRTGTWLSCETGSESLTDLVTFVESLPEATVGIGLNPGNLLVNGFDLEGLAKAAKHVMLVHAKDGVRDLARGRGSEVPLGRGLAEFPEIIAMLAEHRFQGYYVVERDVTGNAFEEVAQAVEFLKNVA
jgi:sugar phosphate isomerase/epimerase